jgi:hypothetical protein
MPDQELHPNDCSCFALRRIATTIPGKATTLPVMATAPPGMATTIPRYATKVVAFSFESVVAFDRNQRLPWPGIGSRLRAEYACD